MKQIYAKIIPLFMGVLLIFNIENLNAQQCTAPTSIGASTIVHASCPGSGEITVGEVLPVIEGSTDYYQYALYNNSNVLIKPYQASNIFTDVNAGDYNISVRRACQSGFSAPITSSVTINDTEAMSDITSITLNRQSACNNGRFTVTATGSGPLQYALVQSMNALETIPKIREKQTSNVFDDLPSGNYYVRVYNACNNAVTQMINVPEFTEIPATNVPKFSPLGCDSFEFRFQARNVLNIVNTVDTGLTRAWMIWPDNTVDSINISTTPAGGANRNIIKNFHLSKLDSSYDETLGFWEGLSNFPYEIEYGFKNACGEIATSTYTLVEPVERVIAPLPALSNPLTTCDSVAYRIRIQYENQNYFHQFGSADDFKFSIDNGVTWSDLATVAGVGEYSRYFLLPRGIDVNVMVDMCGDVVSKNITAAPLGGLTANATNRDHYSCTGFGGIVITKGNIQGTTIGVEMLSAPAGQAIVPYFETSTFGSYIEELNNLLPGSYTIRILDNIDAECTRTIDRTVNVSAYQGPSFDIAQNCDDDMYVTQTSSIKLGGSLFKVKVYDENEVLVLGGDGGKGFSWKSSNPAHTVMIPSDSLNTLPDGNYVIRGYKDRGTLFPYLESCTSVDGTWTKTSNNLHLNQSRFIPGCPGGTGSIVAVADEGQAPYSYVLTDPQDNEITPFVAGSHIFNDLNVNTTYNLQVTDMCGVVVNRTMSIGDDLAVFISDYSLMPCPGDDVTLYLDDMPGVTYQWYKEDVLMPGETNHSLTITNIQSVVDSGTYHVGVEIGSCLAMASGFRLNPDECDESLPIQLKSFDAYAKGQQTILEWETAMEANNQGFFIERSEDGKQWSQIGFIKSKADEQGNHSGNLTYNFVDNHPVKGWNLYRLKQVDYDGKFDYSMVRKVNFNLIQHAVSIYPNPAKDYMIIEGLTQNAHIQITNAVGQEVIKEITESSTLKLHINSLPSGMYYIHILQDGLEAQVEKVMITK